MNLHISPRFVLNDDDRRELLRASRRTRNAFLIVLRQERFPRLRTGPGPIIGRKQSWMAWTTDKQRTPADFFFVGIRLRLLSHVLDKRFSQGRGASTGHPVTTVAPEQAP